MTAVLIAALALGALAFGAAIAIYTVADRLMRTTDTPHTNTIEGTDR